MNNKSRVLVTTMLAVLLVAVLAVAFSDIAIYPCSAEVEILESYLNGDEDVTADEAIAALAYIKSYLDSGAASRSAFSTYSEEGYYVLNVHTRKFHLPSCNSVKAISEKNRELWHGSREALIDQGYSPCGSCNP
ncbi:MAG: hypothetical protein IKP40_14040 [Clostridia bacterium]|nr:hypothetical protein [Clostridia bacterium]